MAKRKTNIDLVNDLMNVSPYGALGQMFIIQAIEYYCTAVIEAPIEEEKKNSFINPAAWRGTAEDVKKRMDQFYKENK